VFNKSGWAKKEWSYYKNGNIREIRYYNRDQKLSFNDEGFSIAQFDYDKNGNRIAATYLDPYGKAVNTFGGYAHRKWHFKQLDDKSRTHIKATFYDEDLKPKKHLEGYAKILFLLDEKGNMIEQSFFGLDDKAVLFRSSFFRASVLRDKLGNPIEERYFGLDDALKENAYGFSIVKRQYETKLMVPISEAYYNKEGKACLSNQNKIHKWKSYYFDENFNYSGNLYAQAYFDTMLCLSKGKHGFAFLEMEKDPTDHQLKPLPILDMNSAYLHLQQYETLTKTQLGCMDSLDKTPY
jgi:YD repeat-containing protein